MTEKEKPLDLATLVALIRSKGHASGGDADPLYVLRIRESELRAFDLPKASKQEGK